MGVRFYCGIGEKRWNYHPVAPGQFACISPVTGSTEGRQRKNSVYVPPGVQVLQDSGAFSDGSSARLSPALALQRQIRHAEQYGYLSQVTHVASYDLLIDEKWQNGKRVKSRWDVRDAEYAVDETIQGAEYIAKNRNAYPNDPDLVINAQGVEVDQYMKCVHSVVPYMDISRDTLGLGGWCITGKMRKQMMPIFSGVMREVIPEVKRMGVQRVHIWGVVFPVALGGLLWLCDQYGISLSTDSVGPQKKPALGSWGYGNWLDRSYRRPPVDIRGLERKRHVETTIEWLNQLENTEYYHPLV